MSSSTEACPSGSTKAAASELHVSDGEKLKSRQEEEEKLILAAWRSLQPSPSEDSAAPLSFLAKQRQSSQTRRVRSARLESRKELCLWSSDEQNEDHL